LRVAGTGRVRQVTARVAGYLDIIPGTKHFYRLLHGEAFGRSGAGRNAGYRYGKGKQDEEGKNKERDRLFHQVHHGQDNNGKFFWSGLSFVPCVQYSCRFVFFGGAGSSAAVRQKISWKNFEWSFF
jgi:hypothetical protein